MIPHQGCYIELRFRNIYYIHYNRIACSLKHTVVTQQPAVGYSGTIYVLLVSKVTTSITEVVLNGSVIF